MEESCFHCHDEIIGKGFAVEEKKFCCNGCKSVYLILHENNLDAFYTLDQKPGVKPSNSDNHKYTFLEVENIAKKFIAFEDENTVKVSLFLPSIHCSSCIYLLENINKIEPAVLSCQVNFTKREAILCYNPKKLNLSQLAQLLDNIGYAPNFGSKNEEEKKIDKVFMYKLGVAGFAFGSIMLWSFPEYLGIHDMDKSIRNFTSYLSLFISIPVFFYSANEYFISAYKALKFKSLNLDVPISIGILALYSQSLYSIINGDGPGYMDSFAGFIFFLLIGKWFQNKTYKSLSFERDYSSYFPVAVTRISNNSEEIIEIEDLKENDTILIRNEEVIPCDSTLNSDEAKIDYSFVTGEENPIIKKKGDFIYAGGKLLGQRSEFKVNKESNRSHLTQLWNDVSKNKNLDSKKSTQDKISLYFLTGLLIISFIAAIYWFFKDVSNIVPIVVSVLIIACPCALALSSPFTFGNVMRVLGRKGLYLKNTSVIEDMNNITDIVFDKTGTLTTGSLNGIEFIGDKLSLDDKIKIIAAANSSTHPLSRNIVRFLRKDITETIPEIEHYKEYSGKGLEALCNNSTIKIGSELFVCGSKSKQTNETATYISISGVFVGKFLFHSEIRSGIEQMTNKLKKYKLHILSGDSDKDRVLIASIFPQNTAIHFQQTPKNKFEYIENLKKKGKKVLMIGDGLNDSGALGIADVGIAVSEDIFRFSPSSDAIIEANKLYLLPSLLKQALFSKTVLTTCLSFSLAYNVIGLTLAITNQMSPLVAAILMPISSISVVAICTGMVMWKGRLKNV